jgi:hypothetical protein
MNVNVDPAPSEGTAQSPQIAPDWEDETSSPEYLAMQAKLQGTNINGQTFLATDYLNHFNEVVMLMGMIPDMPDCLEDVMAWEPKSYEQHFAESGFSDKELAIAAYALSPAQYRVPFDRIVSHMDGLVSFACRVMQKAWEAGDNERMIRLAKNASKKLQRLIDRTSAVIHGNVDTMEQSEIDGLLKH